MAIALIVALACVFAGEAALLWTMKRGARRIEQMESRIEHYTDALSLLAETSEAGFGSVARELERLSAGTRKPARAPSARRLTAAARKGRSVPEIAAAEQLSEGEVRLRLHLAGHQIATEGQAHGALRA